MQTNESTKQDLERKLRAAETDFDRQMRARGFDPAQAENVALTASLTKLYLELERLRTAVQEMNDDSRKRVNHE